MSPSPRTGPTVTAVVAVITTLALAGAAQAATAPVPRPPGADVPSAGRGGPSARETAAATRFARVVAGTRTVEVDTDGELRAALDDAAPGEVIRLAPGEYAAIEVTGDGTAAAPVTLAGPPDAVVVGDGGYAVHVRDARHWQLVGFTVRGGGKGVVLDDAQSVLLDSLTVGRTGDEAVHFRSASSDNVLQRSRIHDTGLRQPQYGEGAYVGSARSNWKRYGRDGGPDLSMRNRVLGNRFERITAENVDVKEETAGTVIARNRFDGSAVSGKNYADSVVDVKGYAALVVDNVTTGRSPALGNIIETHVITRPATSGCGNRFRGNRVEGFEPRGKLLAIDPKCNRRR